MGTNSSQKNQESERCLHVVLDLDPVSPSFPAPSVFPVKSAWNVLESSDRQPTTEGVSVPHGAPHFPAREGASGVGWGGQPRPQSGPLDAPNSHERLAASVATVTE